MAQNPLLAVPPLAGLALLGGGAALAPAAVYRARHALVGKPSDLVVGDRSERFLDEVVSHPVYLSWTDRCMHTRLWGPTGSGKTTALLPWILQDFMAGRTVVLVQIHGDLAHKAIRYAEAIGVPVRSFDLDDPGSLKWNPLAGHSTEDVAERAASAVKASVSDHPHYEAVAEDVTRNFVTLSRRFAAHKGLSECDADLELFSLLLTDRAFLERVLGVTPVLDEAGKDTGKVRINAPWLDAHVATWFENDYLVWSERFLRENVIGVAMLLRRVLAKAASRHGLCPRPGEPVLDLFAEMQGASAGGRLVVVNVPVDAAGSEPARAIAYWALKTIQEATETRPEGAEPLCVYLDELPTLIGRGSRDEVNAMSDWFALVRKLNVAITVAFQGTSQLPDILDANLETNARNTLISGGLPEQDIRRVQRALGEEQDVESESVRSGVLGTEVVTSRNRSKMEKPRYAFDALRYLAAGEWLWLPVKDRAAAPPVRIRTRRPVSPEKYARLYERHRAGREG